MKISFIIYSMLIAQVSTSFLDVFQGAMHSVQNSFGKLLSDVVTDVTVTVDCTILAIEQVFSLSADATVLYNDKCGGGNNTTVPNNQSKENNASTLEISFSSNQDYLNKLLPGVIDSRINDTATTDIYKGYNPHEKLADVERELAKETKRFAGISDLVKRQLEKLSAESHIDLGRQLKNDTIPSVDNILQELRLLEAVEQNIKNSSEANQIHKMIENVLHKLNAIEASEVSENNIVHKILKDLEKKSNGTYKDLRKRLSDSKKEEDRHLDLIKNKIEQHKTSPEHSAYIEENKSNNTEIIKNSTHTTQPDIIYKTSKNSSSFAALNVTPFYGSTTNLINVTTSTISPTFAPLGSLHKKSTDNSTPLSTETINNSTHTTQPDPIYKLIKNSNSFAALNGTPFYGATTSLVNVTTLTISPTLAHIESLPEKSFVNITSLSTDKTVASTSTTTPKIEVRTKGNIIPKSSTTDSGVHLVGSLYNSDLQPVIITTTPAISSAASLPSSLMKVSTTLASSALKTTLKIYESSTKSNDSDNNVATLRTSIKSKILMFTTPKTERSTIVAAKQITPIETHKQFSTAQTDVEITTPVSISTNSYVNKYKSSITESILNTVSPTTINSIANTINQDFQPDKTFNETLTSDSASSTTEQMVIVVVDHSITNATPDVSSEISSVIPITQRYHSKKHNLRGPVTSTQSTVLDSYDIQNGTMGFTTSQATIKLSKHSTITTPSPDEILKYIDRIVTSTFASSTTKSKNIPKSLADKKMQDPWLTQSYNVLSKATSDIINKNSIAPLNEKSATHPYDHPPRHSNKGIPSLTAFKPSKIAYYHDPSLSARNDQFMNKEKLLPSHDNNETSVPEISLPSRSSYASFKKKNASFPYAGVNNNPAILKRNVSRLARLLPINRRHDENRASVVTNDKDPPEGFNEKSDTQKSTHPKMNNFDDSDYGSFFHLPSKDAEHERALREARKLIKDSQKAHRLMQRLLTQ